MANCWGITKKLRFCRNNAGNKRFCDKHAAQWKYFLVVASITIFLSYIAGLIPIPWEIKDDKVEKNVTAIQSQAKGFETLSSDQKNKVLKLIYHLAQNMARRDSAFINDRSVDFVNHVISKRSAGIPWDEVNLLSELFVELNEPSLRILSAYTALQTYVITIWRTPEPRAYPGEVSKDGRDKMKVYHEIKCGWIAIDEATRNFRTQLIAVTGWHYAEEGRGRVELLEKGKALIEYINGSIPIHTQLLK